MDRSDKLKKRLLAGSLAAVMLTSCGARGGDSSGEEKQSGGGGGELLLNEYMTSNGETIDDNYGNSSDWIEIYNSGGEKIDLSGMGLSDRLSEHGKWKFPSGAKIGGGEYLLVWCDGLDEFKDGELHASFKLGNEDDGIVLTDKNGGVIFSVPIERPGRDISCGRAEDGSYVLFTKPTPGKKNGLPEEQGVQQTTTAAPAASPAVDKVEKPAVTTVGNDAPAAEKPERPISEDVFLSEVSATGNGGVDCDWVELGNRSGADKDLSGWGIGEDPDRPEYIFQGLKVPSGGKLLLYADGSDKGGEHLPIKIGLDGDEIYLFDKEGNCRDKVEFERLSAENTCGSGENGETVFYAEPTPGKENPNNFYKGYARQPVFSNAGGYAEKGEKLTVQAESGVTVRYTADGSLPAESSKVFTGYTISKNCVIKAVAYREGYLPSEVCSETFIVGEEHDIPIVCLSCAPDDLFSSERGILAFGDSYEKEFPYVGANFWQDWEREVSFEFYTADGQREIACEAGAKVFGQFSRAYDQKSLAIHFRGKYGCSSVNYPFFEGNDISSFSSLVLRAGGQDQGFTRIRDAFCTEAFSEYSDIAYMDWQPVAVYINGEYYGYYDLREKINESYFQSHEGIDKKKIDILKGNGQIVIAGDNADYYRLVDWIKSHDLSVKENYEYVCSQIDVDNYIDYLIAEIFFCNGDTGNIKFYREQGGKWKWILFDLDMAMRGEATWGDSYNSIKMMFDPDGHGSQHSFSTAVQCGLLKNDQFKEKFLKRYAQLLGSCFTPENLIAVEQRMTAEMDSEMKLHGKRWQKPVYDDWKANITALENVCRKRQGIAKQQLISFLGVSEKEQNELF